jgi:pyrimidine operon attenuation protein/uracil phosphoribosyltransferase
MAELPVQAAGAGQLVMDAEALYRELLRGVARLRHDDAHLVGITSGGAWLAQRLHADLQLAGQPGVISSAMHRDDFAQRGMSSHPPSRLPFEVNGAHIIIVDDVLYTGRTIRAVINELFDYGRPASVRLAVLVDRGGRELPIEADFAAARVVVAANQSLALGRADGGLLSFRVESVA